MRRGGSEGVVEGEEATVMSRFMDALAGRARLTTVFWGYCIGGTLALSAIVMAALPAALRFDHRLHYHLTLSVVMGLLVIYFLWAHLCLWRCAFNAKHRAWGYVARCYVVAIFGYYFAGLWFHSPPQPVEILRVVTGREGRIAPCTNIAPRGCLDDH
jgi:hypothetical protein